MASLLGIFIINISPLLGTFALPYLNIGEDYLPAIPHLLQIIPVVLLFVMTRYLLGRPFYSLLGPTSKVGWSMFAIGMAVTLGTNFLNVLEILPFHRLSFQGWDLELGKELPMLLLLFIGLLIQTGIEEFYFRGLLMQGTYRLVRFMLVVVLVPSLIFANMHIGNVKVWGEGLSAAAPYLFLAVSFGYAAWRTGSLYFSWGLHFGNNLFLTILVNPEGDVAVKAAPFVMQTPTLLHSSLFALFTMLVSIVVVECLYRKRYADRSYWTLIPKDH